MSDAPATTTLPTQDGKPTFGIVPTLDGFLELVSRVDHLEANTPAVAGEDNVDEDELSQLHDRLDRHRTEIEEIKRRYNALIRYLDSGMSTATPAANAAPADTVQPQTRNLIQ